MIRVAILDDHPVTRRGMAQILTETGSIDVVASAATQTALLDELACGFRGGSPDVIVLELYHEGAEPCLPLITSLRSQSRVLVISGSDREADVLGAILAGASGYVTKQADPRMLVAAVQTIASGGFALSAQLVDVLRAELTRTEPGRRPGLIRNGRRTSGGTQLSAREEEALGLIAQGFTHAQAATRMGISKATIDTYVERVRAKLRVGNKADLTRVALERMNGIPLT